MKGRNGTCDDMMKELSSICILAHTHTLHVVKQSHSSMLVRSRDSTRTHRINFVYRLIDNFQFVMGEKPFSKIDIYVKHGTSNNLSGHGLRSEKWQMAKPAMHELFATKTFVIVKEIPSLDEEAFVKLNSIYEWKWCPFTAHHSIQLTRIPILCALCAQHSWIQLSQWSCAAIL